MLLSSPGIEPGSSQPQCEILTTVRTRPILNVAMYIYKPFNCKHLAVPCTVAIKEMGWLPGANGYEERWTLRFTYMARYATPLLLRTKATLAPRSLPKPMKWHILIILCMNSLTYWGVIEDTTSVAKLVRFDA